MKSTSRNFPQNSKGIHFSKEANEVLYHSDKDGARDFGSLYWNHILTETRTRTEHTTEINTIMCTALIVKLLLQLAFDLNHPERERACYVSHHKLGPVCSTRILHLTVECGSLNTWPALTCSQAASQSDVFSPCSAKLQELSGATLIEIHVGFGVCTFRGWIARVFSRSFVCRFLLRLLLSIDRTVLLGRCVLLRSLYSGLGLGHNGITSREQFLKTQRKRCF